MTGPRLVVTDALPPERANDGALGGKGHHLVRLRGLGLPVPPFVIVTSRAFDEAVGRSREVEVSTGGLESAGAGALAAASRRITRHIRAKGCPADLAEELRAALAERGLLGARLAVRSSAIGEDSARHSFAGLMETRLNVGVEDVPAALVEVWASAFSPGALAYRQRKGVDLRRIRTAVIVQEMVWPASAGVLFTRDPGPPVHGGSLIVAARGLGEGVVQGTVEADTYRLGSGGEVETRRGGQTSWIVPAATRGTRSEALPKPLRQRAVLRDDEVRRLDAVGGAIEGAMGSPQDVEWAFDKKGRLFVLQTRPIVPGEPTGEGERRLWDNSNIVESYPGLTLPLTFSFVRSAYAQAFRRACAAFFPLANPLESRPQLFETLLGLLDGRVYYNLLSWYEMFSFLARPERHRRTWDRMVGVRVVETPSPLPEDPRPLSVRAMAALGALRILLGVRGHGRRFARSFDAFYRRHRDAARSSTLAARYRRVEREAARFWHLTLFTDLCAMRYHEWVATLAARWMPEHEDLTNRLLAASEGVESVGPARSLARIVSHVRSAPVWRERFARESDTELWRSLQAAPSAEPLRAALEAHVEAFGDRGIEELKLETVTFREKPESLLALVRRLLDTGPSVGARREDQDRRRREAERIVAERLGGPRRLVFGMVLERARAAIRNRENMRLARGRLFGIVRGLFRGVGEQLAAAGVLAQAADVFYLTTDEVLGCVEGTGVTCDLRALVALRRREYAGFAKRRPADRFETHGLPLAAPVAKTERLRDETRRLGGTGCSAGIVTGPARVVHDPRADTVRGDQVLVARSTDPGWVFLMMSAAGLVAERGSPLSHTAIIGRELGIPTVVGVEGATARIPDGARLTIDGGNGDVQWA
jgi:pyruvate,water dikinase